MEFNLFTYVIVPLLILIARVIDVTIVTIKVIFISKGYKAISAVMGFVEILIWLIAMQQIIINFTNPLCYVAYAMGLAIGTYLGIGTEEKLSIGKRIIRIITKRDATELIKKLKNLGYKITTMQAQGPSGKVKIIFTIVDRYDIDEVVGHIREFNPAAFYSIEDVRFAKDSKPVAPISKRIMRTIKLNVKQK